MYVYFIIAKSYMYSWTKNTTARLFVILLLTTYHKIHMKTTK